MSNLLASGGIDVVSGSPDDFSASELNIACVCSSDEIYASEAESAARTLAEQGAQHIMLAGKPGKVEEQLIAAGVQQFVHAGQNVLTLLDELSMLARGEAS